MTALRHVSIALCLLALLSAAGCEKKPVAFRLDNGLRVDLLPAAHGDRAALVVLFDVGADDDPPGRSGMTHVIEHLLSTSTRPGRTLAPTVATQAGADYTMYASEVGGGRITEEIDDVALRLSGQPVTEAELTRVRKMVVDEIARAHERDAAATAMTRAAEALRPSRGAGMRGGVAADIGAITPTEVDGFHRDHYGAAAARLIVTGRFNVADVEARVRAALGPLPAGKPPDVRAPAGARVTGALTTGDAPKATALAMAAPDVKDPLYPAFLVLAARLAAAGEGDGARSWKVDYAPLARPDVLFVTSPVPAGLPQQAEPAAERMRTEVAAIVGAPLAPDEPARALARFGAQLGISAAVGPRDTAFAAGRLLQLGLDAKALERGVNAVTQQQLAAAARLF